MQRILEALRQFFAQQKWIAWLLSASIIKGFADLGRLIWFYLANNPINWDSMVYLTIGRGILNGMLPYTGLYEQKPPGIFLISALSLFMTDDERFGLWIQVILQLAIPVMFAWAAYAIVKKTAEQWATFALLSGLAFGLTVSLYAESRSIAFQTEGFGIFFALIYIISIVLPGRMTLVRTLVAALGILGAVGMKEPFLLSVIAAALVLREEELSTWKSFLKQFIIPFIIAAISGLAIMAMLGYLHGYFTVHLPFIFNSRLSEGLPIPLRGLAVGHVFIDTFIAPMSLFGILMGFIVYYTMRRPDISLKQNASSALYFLLSIIAITCIWYILEISDFAPRMEWLKADILHQTIRNFFDGPLMTIWRRIVVSVLALLSVGALFAAPRVTRSWFITLMASFYLVSLAAAVGGFFGSHMLFALPLYCALFFVMLRKFEQFSRPELFKVIFASILVATSFVTFPGDHYEILKKSIPHNAESNKELGEAFDNIMQGCGIKDYFVIGDGSFLTSHTHYSPMGPLAFQLPFMSDDHPMLYEYYNKGLTTGQMAVLIENARNYNEAAYYLDMNGFTTQRPPCAGSHRLPTKYLLYFRS